MGFDGNPLFKVHRQTLEGGFSEPLLDDLKGERLEWMTKARHTQCVYGLLMRLEPAAGSAPSASPALAAVPTPAPAPAPAPPATATAMHEPLSAVLPLAPDSPAPRHGLKRPADGWFSVDELRAGAGAVSLFFAPSSSASTSASASSSSSSSGSGTGSRSEAAASSLSRPALKSTVRALLCLRSHDHTR